MTDRGIITHLAEKVLGWKFAAGGWWKHIQTPQEKMVAGAGWNPLESIEDAFQVQAAIPEVKVCLYISKLRYELGLQYPLSAFGQHDLFKIASATPRQRCLAAVEATR